ncbi:hypothetical protein DL546_009701 [Coniochaeta pulveracea]|uniref:N-acetyltransferase domain-containing protein n=1 Tax=Coniochaeta pulveracea TaxID=177199 RepID=A0A420YN21_9PEZI|nr:hypothetical protein DL546_009701 [Coniochaeta pulveracea]
MPPPTTDLKTWAREVGDDTYLCTTDPEPIDLAALKAALGSDLMWWANPVEDQVELKKMVDHSLCFSLYHVWKEGDRNHGRSPMVGFARVITDYVTFAYLTDVYVLPEHQGKGLGVWMMECLDKVLKQWPGLRRTMLMARDEHAKRMYERVLGMKRVTGAIMEGMGPGATAALKEL